MLGMVFTEFMDMVEETFSPETADELMEECSPHLASGGAYTSVGYYQHDEMLALVRRLSIITQIAEPQLIFLYGKHLFGRFNDRYPIFFENVDGTYPFLESVHNHIHVEVRKLYGDSRPPSLQCRRQGDDRLVVEYRSDRPFAMLAHGLIVGCIEHFSEAIEVTVEDIEPEGRHATFQLAPSTATAGQASRPGQAVPSQQRQ